MFVMLRVALPVALAVALAEALAVALAVALARGARSLEKVLLVALLARGLMGPPRRGAWSLRP